MSGKIVELGKNYHVVCDGRDHWYRSAIGYSLQSKKIKVCDCRTQSDSTPRREVK